MKVNKKQNSNGNVGRGKAQRPRGNPRRNGASRNPEFQSSIAAAYSTGNSSRAPKLTSGKDSYRVVHRELLGNVDGTASAAFTLNSTFPINPGMQTTFPWLGIIAQNWEAYRFNKLRLCYYTRSGSTTKGSVILAVDYDSSDPAPGTEKAVSSYQGTREDAVWKDNCLDLMPSSLHNLGPRKFVRTGALSPNQDIKTYDAGNLFICTVGSEAASSWGKLWIEYDVSFYIPQISNPGVSFGGTSIMFNQTGLSDANLTGTNPEYAGDLGFTGVANTFLSNNLTIGVEYLVCWFITGTVITQAPELNSSDGFDNIKNVLFDGFPAAATSAASAITIKATATTGNLEFQCTATTVSLVRLSITAIPGDILGF